MADINFTKLRALGYQSVDDLPPKMLDGLAPDALAELHKELPTRRVPIQLQPVDYGKGKGPTRAAIVGALQAADVEAGGPGQALRDAAAMLVLKAQQGDMSAWDRIADRLDGKPGQHVEMDVHMSLEALIMQSIKLESEPVRSLDVEQKAITVDQ